MTSRKPPKSPQIQQHRFRSTDEIDRGIRSLERRIEEVQALDPRRIVVADTGDDNIVCSNIRDTLGDVFGLNSPEFEEHQYIEIFAGPAWMGMGEHDLIEAKEKGKVQVRNILQGLIDRLNEKREHFASPTGPRPEDVLEQLDLHSRVADVATELFRDGHHWEAVFAASKAVVNYVKERSGRHDLDGAQLMRTVFSKNDPVLRFNDLSDQTDSDEQEGLMHLFEGVVLAVRNPGGHDFPKGPPELALQYISLLSLLSHLAQKAKR